MLAGLHPRYRQVIEWRVFDKLTLVECGERLGVTRERARQVEGQALVKLVGVRGGAGEDAGRGVARP